MNENKISSFPMPIRGYLMMISTLEKAMHIARQQCAHHAAILHQADVLNRDQLKEIASYVADEDTDPGRRD